MELFLFYFIILGGEVVHAEVIMSREGRSKGCGIVEYTTAEEAKRAIEQLSDQTLMGRPVFVREVSKVDSIFSRFV